ncbi:hypothetical protein J3R30DRAFT_3696792 [Lentinula aciculospora]|uniref:F-box domain-containing protein n=1 Tax=Lentinula aciculospora TaxID=153920 RepID=A0A9W9AN41_9AGAR|nr:hypothetical protein J3R30DRAFT_3696792 [Lentinula aciculospora]
MFSSSWTITDPLDSADETQERVLAERWHTFSLLPTTQLRAILTEEQIYIRFLHDKLTAAERKVAMVKTILSPFSRLPKELISEIFHFYCATQGVLYDAFQKPNARTRPSKVEPDRIVSGVYTIPPQLILTQVCGYWRNVAHETRSLWTTLTVYIQSGKFVHHGELIRKWLGHTGQNMPLDISLFVPKGKGPATKSIVRSIVPFADRWRRLELSAPLQTLLSLFMIRTPLDAPLLEHVRMNVCHFTESSIQAYAMNVTWVTNRKFTVFHNAPKLHSFDCGAVFDPESDQEETFSFLSIIPNLQTQQITHLALNGDAYVPSSSGGGLYLLGIYAPNLVSVSVKLCRDISDEAPFPLIFPKLRSLSLIVTYPSDAHYFLKQITLPMLEAFEFELGKDRFMSADTFEDVMRMQARSSFVLKELAVFNGSDAPNLIEFFAAQNSVRRLTLSAASFSKFQSVVNWISERPSAFPFLQELHLLGGQKKLSIENPFVGLAKIAQIRAHLPGILMDPSRNLQLLNIRMSKTAFERMNKKDVNSLQQFRDLGLDIRVQLWLLNGTLVNVSDHVDP